MAWVYLIHMADGGVGNERHRAIHYIGSTVDLQYRIGQHRHARLDDPKSARLIAHANARGIPWDVVRTWETETEEAARRLERRLKSWKKHRVLCPVCRRGHEST